MKKMAKTEFVIDDLKVAWSVIIFHLLFFFVHKVLAILCEKECMFYL